MFELSADTQSAPRHVTVFPILLAPILVPHAAIGEVRGVDRSRHAATVPKSATGHKRHARRRRRRRTC